MLVAALASWMHMPSREFRLDCAAKLDRGRASLREVRLTAGRLKRPDWAGDEPDLGATEFTLVLAPGTARFQARCIACFSLHAIGRFYQRARAGSDADLLAAIALAAEAAGDPPPGGGYRIPTSSGGEWRGRVSPIVGANGVGAPVLAIRTCGSRSDG